MVKRVESQSHIQFIFYESIPTEGITFRSCFCLAEQNSRERSKGRDNEMTMEKNEILLIFQLFAILTILHDDKKKIRFAIVI